MSLGRISLLSLIVISAQAATLYSTDGTSTPTFSDAGGFSLYAPLPPTAIAMRFLASQSGTVVGVTVPLSANVTGPSSETFELLTEAAGIPGSVLDTLTFTGISGSGPALYTANSTLHPTLIANTPYWLEATATDQFVLIAWYSALPGVNGTVWASSAGLEANQELAAFALSGQNVPEPSAVCLFVAGALSLLGMFKLRERRRQQRRT